MSQYSRNERNANAGIVVGINPEPDFPGGPLAGVALQEALESKAFVLGGSDYCAPGQLVGDFLRGVASTQLGEVDAVVHAGRAAGRPVAVAAGLRHRGHPRGVAGVRQADRAASIATTPCSPASRAAPPRRCASRATRNRCRASTCAGSILAAKAPGYAGGILSAGVDGIKVAEAVARSLA